MHQCTWMSYVSILNDHHNECYMILWFSKSDLINLTTSQCYGSVLKGLNTLLDNGAVLRHEQITACISLTSNMNLKEGNKCRWLCNINIYFVVTSNLWMRSSCNLYSRYVSDEMIKIIFKSYIVKCFFFKLWE